MRRTQLYLDDQLWSALHARARGQKTTISALVREAVRERYPGAEDEKRRAMLAFVGIRKDQPAGKTRAGATGAVAYVQSLRRGDRVERLHKG